MSIKMKSDAVYYLIKSGEVKKRAEEYRRRVLALRAGLWEVINTLGGEKASICDTMWLIRAVKFPRDKTPEGWTKPDRDGLSRPRKCKQNAGVLKHFTPSGCYSIKPHPDTAVFFEWLGCPTSYRYTHGENCSGSNCIGDFFNATGVYWYSEDGPLLLKTPDVAGAKAHAAENGYVVKNNVLDWTPPKGLKRILIEEWDLMQAKYEAAK